MVAAVKKVSVTDLALELRERGLLLEADAHLPSIARAVIGGPFKGSWSGHPKGDEIQTLSNELLERPGVLAVKLVSGKITFVHRALWPALYAVANSREPWQLDKLPAAGRTLLEETVRRGLIRCDRMPGSPTKLAKVLEERLLVLGADINSEKGSQVRTLESWPHWARRVGFIPPKLKSEEARAQLAQAAAALANGTKTKLSFPWAE